MDKASELRSRFPIYFHVGVDLWMNQISAVNWRFGGSFIFAADVCFYRPHTVLPVLLSR
jgi:hypothetical protein